MGDRTTTRDVMRVERELHIDDLMAFCQRVRQYHGNLPVVIDVNYTEDGGTLHPVQDGAYIQVIEPEPRGALILRVRNDYRDKGGIDVWDAETSV